MCRTSLPCAQLTRARRSSPRDCVDSLECRAARSSGSATAAPSKEGPPDGRLSWGACWVVGVTERSPQGSARPPPPPPPRRELRARRSTWRSAQTPTASWRAPRSMERGHGSSSMAAPRSCAQRGLQRRARSTMCCAARMPSRERARVMPTRTCARCARSSPPRLSIARCSRRCPIRTSIR